MGNLNGIKGEYCEVGVEGVKIQVFTGYSACRGVVLNLERFVLKDEILS